MENYTKNNFTPPSVLPSFWNESRTRIMESYWCMKKNSITNWILYGIDFDPTLTPCLKSECTLWNNGWCIHIRKVGK